MTRSVRLAFLVLSVAACGDNRIHSQADGGVDAPPDTVAATCGNGLVEQSEDCDDGNTDADPVCDASCRFTCGNGVVDADFDEACDTSIATGTGACPTACTDSDACTSDVLAGSACAATCMFAPITAAADGDGCCPSGANANSDDDCEAMCGNGILESGESCDTGITVGAGACPLACDDNVACTTDTLTANGSCDAACVFTPITTPADNDGCCPTGATPATDDDCAPGCGNGVVDAGETCDTAITSGAGQCPTSCDDSMACTQNVLDNAGTCTAACVFPPITAPTPSTMDGCCVSGANANTDLDCPAMCGNGVREGTEACDDGNDDDGDACTNSCMLTAAPTAFRLTDLDLRDPHLFTSILGCNDVTESFLTVAGVNPRIEDAIQGDANNDGLYDLSPTIVFRPLSQGSGATSPVELHFAECTTGASTSCSPGSDSFPVTATSQTAGTCLAPTAGTVHTGAPTYMPGVTSAIAPCFSTSPTTVTISLSGIPLTLHDGQLGATFVGTPANSLTNGLLKGFITEADADATTVNFGLGDMSLSSLLPGGTSNCASFSDKDVHNGEPGWWFYLNFPATSVTWSDN